MRTFHDALADSVASCPWSWRIADRLKNGTGSAEAQTMARTPPEERDLVVAHGDLRAPNILLHRTAGWPVSPTSASWGSQREQPISVATSGHCSATRWASRPTSFSTRTGIRVTGPRRGGTATSTPSSEMPPGACSRTEGAGQQGAPAVHGGLREDRLEVILDGVLATGTSAAPARGCRRRGRDGRATRSPAGVRPCGAGEQAGRSAGDAVLDGHGDVAVLPPARVVDPGRPQGQPAARPTSAPAPKAVARRRPPRRPAAGRRRCRHRPESASSPIRRDQRPQVLLGLRGLCQHAQLAGTAAARPGRASADRGRRGREGRGLGCAAAAVDHRRDDRPR